MATRETQALIIDTALALFNRHGSSNISTNRIAAECGISRGNLHYHFRNKAEIVYAIFQRISHAMHDEWPADHLEPTLEHMAKMYVRQSMLILEFEFFYREMAALLRQDSLLRRRYREHRERRIDAICRFLTTLAEQGIMDFGADRAMLRPVVIATWIISDNWPNFVEFSGREFDAEAICQGYDMILHMLAPYITVGFEDVTRTSHETIHALVAELPRDALASAG
ncbi:TetR/AcrR family transcriptional regulator [Elongatibacter sediminis]|uniref:TetR/AcrR family transcriptional regulator n=1 Tax=Elongatibacter sediminis TaxID=3119006 RepID=A0AAW9RGA1_9GAMM